MKKLLALAAMAVAAVLGGCAVMPANPIPLAAESVNAQLGKVGVVMTALPKVDTFFPGADCLLCQATAAGVNSDLTKHARTLSNEDLLSLRQEIAALLRAKGVEVKEIDGVLDLKTLANAKSSKDPSAAKKDFMPLREKYGVDQLVVIQFTAVGFERPYSAYIATGDPKGLLQGMGYMVDLNTNLYKWYLPVKIAKSAESGAWDEPPSYPGLTNAYYSALELGRDEFLNVFRN